MYIGGQLNTHTEALASSCLDRQSIQREVDPSEVPLGHKPLQVFIKHMDVMPSDNSDMPYNMSAITGGKIPAT